MTAKAAKRPVPAGLGSAGRGLWQRVVKVYELREDEAEALRSACRLRDEIGTLEAALKDAPAMVAGSQGQPVTNPLFEDLRRHRKALAEQLKACGFDAAEGQASDAATAASVGARALALKRWKGSGA